MQKQTSKNKVTDFISFLKRSWHDQALPKEKSVSGDALETIDETKLSAENRAKRFYRSVEEGKLVKVLNAIVPDLEIEFKEDRDDASAKLWKKEKRRSEKEILKNSANKKAPAKKSQIVLGNPLSFTFLRERSLDNKTGLLAESLSLTWKYSALALVVLFLSVGYVSLFPAKARGTVSRLDMLISYPAGKAASLAMDLNLLPELSDNKKFANSLPKSNLSINQTLKSEYIKSMNSGKEITLASDGKYIKLTEKDIRGANEQSGELKAEIAVLGLDSESEEANDNVIVRAAKKLFRKIAEKQEQLSLDLNDKLINLIDK